MEGTHGELSARLTDGLRRDDSNGHSPLHITSRRTVHSVASGADAKGRFTGQGRTNHDLFVAEGLDPPGDILGDQLVFRDNHLVGNHIDNALSRDTACD